MSDKHGIKVASKKGRKPKEQKDTESEEADSEHQEEQQIEEHIEPQPTDQDSNIRTF